MTEEKKKWQRFEDLAAKIQQMLAPNAHVEQDVHIVGKSGIDRQIDVAVRATAGQFELFVAIDCKDYVGKVDIEIVEAFTTKLQDIGANKGALITTVGFTAGAKAAAEAAGISLYTLVDAESEDWHSFISIPVLIEELSIQSVAYQVASAELRSCPIDADMPHVSVFRADGSRIGPLRDLVNSLWNEERIPMEPGLHHVGLSIEPTFFETPRGLARVELAARVRVIKTLYLGQLPLVKIQGLQDQKDGSIITNSFRTDRLDVREVCEKWQQVPDETALAVSPILGFGIMAGYALEGQAIPEKDGPLLSIKVSSAAPVEFGPLPLGTTRSK